MLYPYKCSECQHDWEVIKSVRHIDSVELCELCGNTGNRLIAKQQAFSGANDWDTAHYSQVLGCEVKSHADARKIAHSRGLEEVGNENLHKIAETHQRDVERQIDKSYDEAARAAYNSMGN